MDIGALGEVSSSELARELLIAISYSVPDKLLNSVSSENSKSKDGVVGCTVDGADEFRLKLISLSYNQSPESGVSKCNGYP